SPSPAARSSMPTVPTCVPRTAMRRRTRRTLRAAPSRMSTVQPLPLRAQQVKLKRARSTSRAAISAALFTAVKLQTTVQREASRAAQSR
ncbi:hypothetical protein HMPREF9081_2628, partial [Centipeda periodontii DSM 2778]